MDTHTPDDKDDLSDIESRLSGWRPGAEGLDADAMLFAAGRAAGRRGPGRFLVPTLCGLLAVVAAGLGAWGLSERSERQALARLLRERVPPSPTPDPAKATEGFDAAKPSYEPSASDYLTMRRLMEQDPNGALVSLEPEGPQAAGPPGSDSILTPRQRDNLFDQ